jgi:hypothetical protein
VDTTDPNKIAESKTAIVDAATVEVKPVEDSLVANEESDNSSSTKEDDAKPISTPQKPSKICRREIPINLSDPTTWPTPYAPSYFEVEPTESVDAVVLAATWTFGNTLIVGLFHALDLAYDYKCEVYVSKDCWIWDYIVSWFFHEGYTRDDSFWKKMEEVFGVRILDSSDVNDVYFKSLGKTAAHWINSRDALSIRSKQLNAVQIRNRRDTIFRNLFALPNPPCENVKAVGGRYTVIDVPFQDPWNDRVSEYTGHNHTAAFEMRPEYVKSILEPLGMLGQPIFLEKNRMGEDPDRDEVKRLEEDPELKTHLNTGMDVSNDLYMSVLADVFIGNPCSHWSLMIARIRYALGIKNTFVYTEQKDNKWVSFVDDDDYLELYNSTSPWFG